MNLCSRFGRETKAHKRESERGRKRKVRKIRLVVAANEFVHFTRSDKFFCTIEYMQRKQQFLRIFGKNLKQKLGINFEIELINCPTESS